MNDNYEMKLLAGLPAYVDNVPVYSPRLKRIAKIDDSVYSLYLYLCINENLNPIFMTHKCKFYNICHTYSEDMWDFFVQALEFFTGEIFCKHKQDGENFLISENSVLHKNNFDEFVNLVKFANGFSDEKENKIKRNAELDRKIEEAKRKINERLNKKEELGNDIRIIDLVSVLASKHHNLNIINIWRLNIYQFNDQFKQMQLIENYDIGIRQLLAGADKKDVKLEYYIKRK